MIPLGTKSPELAFYHREISSGFMAVILAYGVLMPDYKPIVIYSFEAEPHLILVKEKHLFEKEFASV